jgi:hypothetical protein
MEKPIAREAQFLKHARFHALLVDLDFEVPPVPKDVNCH